MARASPRKPKPVKPAPKKRKVAAGKPKPAARRAAGPSAQAQAPTRIRFVRIVARNRDRGHATSNRFVLVCALDDDRIVDGEWFGKQIYPEEEGGDIAIIVLEGREIRYPAGFWRTNIGQKRIAVGEFFSVFGEDAKSSLEGGDDVWEITHVTTLG